MEVTPMVEPEAGEAFCYWLFLAQSRMLNIDQHFAVHDLPTIG